MGTFPGKRGFIRRLKRLVVAYFDSCLARSPAQQFGPVPQNFAGKKTRHIVRVNGLSLWRG
jgi:hypothetical protein